MAHTKASQKDIRKSRQANLRNRFYRAQVRQALRRVFSAPTAQEAQEPLRRAQSVLDRAVKRGVLHPNTAARRKSALFKHLERLSRGTVTESVASS